MRVVIAGLYHGRILSRHILAEFKLGYPPLFLTVVLPDQNALVHDKHDSVSGSHASEEGCEDSHCLEANGCKDHCALSSSCASASSIVADNDQPESVHRDRQGVRPASPSELSQRDTHPLYRPPISPRSFLAISIVISIQARAEQRIA